MPDNNASRLTELLAPYRARARCPYSGQPDAAAALLSDGTWVPGVRVESASFSLAIDAPLNAITTAVTAGRTDIAAVVLLSPATRSQAAYLEELPFASLHARDHLTFASSDMSSHTGGLPSPGQALEPFIDAPALQTPEAGIALARRLSSNAFTPLSRFPVGCVLELQNGKLISGVNVEHPDWNHILCAERNALGTAVTYGCESLITAVFLSCAHDPNGTPCGACRQLLTELAPDSTIVMDRGNAQPESSTPSSLLPGSFTGSAILTAPDQDF